MRPPQHQQIKMQLQFEAMKRGVEIVGLHSVVLIDDEIADAIFDVEPVADGDGLLHFRFPLPALVKRDELNEFSLWLCLEDGGTVH